MPLFETPEATSAVPERERPLAVRMRPQTLDEFAGQAHFAGEGRILRRLVASGRLQSAILYGPPGTGKTTLAHLLAKSFDAEFVVVNATLAGSKEIREVLEAARARRRRGKRTLLFLDEIHHFNRTQQDLLLPDAEEGTVTLTGATTMNPFFALQGPLLSRSVIFEFKPLSEANIRTLLDRAIREKGRGLGDLPLDIDPDAIAFLAAASEGDARRALSGLEVAALSTPKGASGRIRVTKSIAEECLQKKAIRYDRAGDEHYDHASAFIKSLRGSDPDAALYTLASMLDGGEDPRFIARRLLIFASEDVGTADPKAIMIAASVAYAVEFVGMPECAIPLAHAVCYLACAPKSNASYMGLVAARKAIAETRTLSKPDAIKDANYKGAKTFGHGEGYLYAHDFEGHFVPFEFLPGVGRLYEPGDLGEEKSIRERLERWRKARADAGAKAPKRKDG